MGAINAQPGLHAYTPGGCGNSATILWGTPSGGAVWVQRGYR